VANKRTSHPIDVALSEAERYVEPLALQPEMAYIDIIVGDPDDRGFGESSLEVGICLSTN